MPKKGNYAGINELSESVFFRPPTPQPQNNDKTTDKKDSVLKPEKPPKSVDTPPLNVSPTLKENKPIKMAKAVVQQSQNTDTTTQTNDNEQTNERSFTSSNRQKIRHTFDIRKDQLMSLREIALKRETMFGDRVLLGDLVQEALDMLITKERNNE